MTVEDWLTLSQKAAHTDWFLEGPRAFRTLYDFLSVRPLQAEEWAPGDGTDQTVALNALFAYAETNNRTIVFGPGNWLYNGAGWDSARYYLRGSNRFVSKITLGSGVTLLKPTGTLSAVDVRDLTIDGGEGLFWHTSTGTASGIERFVFERLVLTNYTAAAICTESADSAYWDISKCQFTAINDTAAFGVVMGGDALAAVSITDCAFRKNFAHVKATDGGVSVAMTRLRMFRSPIGGGTHARTDVWVVPDDSGVNAGIGFVMRDCHLSNENLVDGDYRILYADEAAGASRRVKAPSFTLSAGHVRGHRFENVTVSGAGTVPRSPVYSYCKNVSACYYGLALDATVSPYMFQWDALAMPTLTTDLSLGPNVLDPQLVGLAWKNGYVASNGPSWSFIDRAPGALFDHAATWLGGGTNYAAAVQAWHDSLLDENRRTLMLPPGVLAWTTQVNITKPVRIIGAGRHQTFLNVSASTLAFRVREVRSNDSWGPTDTFLNFADDNRGFSMEDLSIMGTNGALSRGIAFEDRNDDVHLRRVAIHNMDQGIEIGKSGTSGQGWLRESSFDDVTIRSCGSATYPALHITKVGTGDSANQLEFTNLRVTYPRGIGIHIENHEAISTGAEVIRRLHFGALELHGTGTQAADLMVIEGNVQAVEFVNLKTNTGTAAFAHVRIKESATSSLRPRRIQINGDLLVTDGTGIIVEEVAQLTIGGTAAGGAALNLTANSVEDWVRLDWNPSASATVIIDSTVASKVFGVTATGKFRLPVGGVEWPDAGGTVRTLGVTSAGLTIGGTAQKVRAYKATDQSVPSSTTVVDDTALQLALTAGDWAVTGYVLYEAATAADLKIQWSSTGGGWTGPMTFGGQTTAATANAGSQSNQVVDRNANVGRGGIGAGTSLGISVMGTITVDVAGTFKIQWAQVVSDATPTIVKAGSWIKAEPL